MEREMPLTPWDAVERTPEGYVLCPNCGAVMLDVTEEEDGEDLEVYWCPRCGEVLFVDVPEDLDAAFEQWDCQ